MESIRKLQSIPLIERSLTKTKSTYDRLKQHKLLWGIQHAEDIILAAAETMQPAVQLMQGPIHLVDQIMCRGIDFVESQVPCIYLPPEMIYSSSKHYMSDQFVRPVVKRTNSVIQMKNAVLENRVSTYAADRLNGALDAANHYVDRFLPLDDQVDEPINPLRKRKLNPRSLTRRLTQRTLTEARALTKQSKEAIHVLSYVAQLIIFDPKLAIQKSIELWTNLSLDEPDNQARPNTLEQLIVMMTRESARKCVHLTNFFVSIALRIPRKVYAISNEAIQRCVQFVLVTLRWKSADAQSKTKLMNQPNLNMDNNQNELMVQMATWLAGRETADANGHVIRNAITPSRRPRRDYVINHQKFN